MGRICEIFSRSVCNFVQKTSAQQTIGALLWVVAISSMLFQTKNNNKGNYWYESILWCWSGFVIEECLIWGNLTSKRDKVTPKAILLKRHQCSCGAIKKNQITTSVFRLSSREDSDGCKTTVLWCRSGWEDWLTRTAYFSARENVLLWEGYDLIWPALVSALLS